MNREDKFTIAMAIQKIAMSVDDDTLRKINPYLKEIETTIIKSEEKSND